MKLLISEHPLLVLPSLAKKIGLNEAIFLQQLHYWTKESDKKYDGRKWTYNTYEKWQEQFPFWSVSTIKRTLASLKKQNLILVGNYNKMKADKTNWYAVNYETLFNMNQPSGQNEPMDRSKWADGKGQSEPSNTLDFPETPSETSTIPYVEIVTYLNNVADKNYRSSTKKTKDLIKARWNEGFRLDDFKKVIDIKTAEWKNNQQMNKFLRPETLFSPKFEGYLNQDTGQATDSQFDELF